MSIGDLNKRITIQYATKASDGMGGFTLTWTNGDIIWAAIWPISANETVQSMQTDMIITHRIRIRYRSVFKPSWRLKFGNRYFNIISILNPNERNEWLDLMCEETT